MWRQLVWRFVVLLFSDWRARESEVKAIHDPFIWINGEGTIRLGVVDDPRRWREKPHAASPPASMDYVQYALKTLQYGL